MTPKSRLDWLEKQLRVAAARHARQHPRPMLIMDDPEDPDDLAAYRLPDWVVDTLGTIELGRPGGVNAPPESTEAWRDRLIREATKIVEARAEE